MSPRTCKIHACLLWCTRNFSWQDKENSQFMVDMYSKTLIRIGVDMWQKLDRNDISLIAGISINDFVAKESGFMEIVYDSNLDVLIISYGNYIPS